MLRQVQVSFEVLEGTLEDGKQPGPRADLEKMVCVVVLPFSSLLNIANCLEPRRNSTCLGPVKGTRYILHSNFGVR